MSMTQCKEFSIGPVALGSSGRPRAGHPTAMTSAGVLVKRRDPGDEAKAGRAAGVERGKDIAEMIVRGACRSHRAETARSSSIFRSPKPRYISVKRLPHPQETARRIRSSTSRERIIHFAGLAIDPATR